MTRDEDELDALAASSPNTGPGNQQARKTHYRGVEEWVEQWFAPCVAVRLTGDGRGLTWCAQWWAHDAVAVRLHALWMAWEAARSDSDTAAMSGWWTRHADPHLRNILDGETGPLWQCSPTHHHPLAALPTLPTPAGWFQRSQPQ